MQCTLVAYPFGQQDVRHVPVLALEVCRFDHLLLGGLDLVDEGAGVVLLRPRIKLSIVDCRLSIVDLSISGCKGQSRGPLISALFRITKEQNKRARPPRACIRPIARLSGPLLAHPSIHASIHAFIHSLIHAFIHWTADDCWNGRIKSAAARFSSSQCD